MTIIKLHKHLSELIAKGQGRKQVTIKKDTFTHPLEGDGCVILPVVDLGIQVNTVIDDDGGTKVRRDGSECYMTSLVLFGEKHP